MERVSVSVLPVTERLPKSVNVNMSTDERECIGYQDTGVTREGGQSLMERITQLRPPHAITPEPRHIAPMCRGSGVIT